MSAAETRSSPAGPHQVPPPAWEAAAGGHEVCRLCLTGPWSLVRLLYVFPTWNWGCMGAETLCRGRPGPPWLATAGTVPFDTGPQHKYTLQTHPYRRQTQPRPPSNRHGTRHAGPSGPPCTRTPPHSTRLHPLNTSAHPSCTPARSWPPHQQPSPCQPAPAPPAPPIAPSIARYTPDRCPLPPRKPHRSPLPSPLAPAPSAAQHACKPLAAPTPTHWTLRPRQPSTTCLHPLLPPPAAPTAAAARTSCWHHTQHKVRQTCSTGSWHTSLPNNHAHPCF